MLDLDNNLMENEDDFEGLEENFNFLFECRPIASKMCREFREGAADTERSKAQVHFGIGREAQASAQRES